MKSTNCPSYFVVYFYAVAWSTSMSEIKLITRLSRSFKFAVIAIPLLKGILFPLCSRKG